MENVVQLVVGICMKHLFPNDDIRQIQTHESAAACSGGLMDQLNPVGIKNTEPVYPGVRQLVFLHHPRNLRLHHMR